MPGSAQDQEALSGFDQVLDNIDRAIDRPPYPAGEANNVAAPVADGRNAVQGAFQAGAVIRVELADALHHVVQVGVVDFDRGEHDLGIDKAGRGEAPQVQDHFQQVVAVIDAD